MILNNAQNIKYGSLQVKKVMRGSSLIWLLFDSDYNAILDYAISQGYALPSLNQRIKQNKLLVDLKNSGGWSKLDTLGVFATDGDSDFALIDWKKLTQYTAVNSPAFTVNQGFKGNGTSSYIDTNFNPTIGTNNYLLNDASRFVFLNSADGTGRLDGASNFVNGMLRNNFSLQRINSSNNLSVAFNFTETKGVKSIHRVNSSDVYLFNDKIGVTTTQTSTILGDSNQYVLRYASTFGAHQVSMYAMGSSLVTENDDFVDAFNTYINSL